MYIIVSVHGRKHPHITQIAASVIGSDKELSTYVYPELPMYSNAQQITGIILHNSRTMTVHGQQVQVEKFCTDGEKICKWLKRHSCVFLIAHNGQKFDFPVMVSALINLKCKALFCESVIGLIGSIPILKKAFPAQSSYKQEDLIKVLL